MITQGVVALNIIGEGDYPYRELGGVKCHLRVIQRDFGHPVIAVRAAVDGHDRHIREDLVSMILMGFLPTEEEGEATRRTVEAVLVDMNTAVEEGVDEKKV